MGASFDWGRLSRAIDEKRTREDMSLEEASASSGVASWTLNRLEKRTSGCSPDVLVLVLRWLREKFEKFEVVSGRHHGEG